MTTSCKARARHLQQQAEAERRVELFAHRRDKAQRAAEEEERDSGSDNSHMDFEAYEELDDEDDGGYRRPSVVGGTVALPFRD